MKTLFFSCLILLGAASKAQEGIVRFQAVSRASVVTVSGEGEPPVAELGVRQGKLSGEVRFRLSSLSTAMPDRDEEMKNRYLNVKEFPEAVLIFKDFPMPAGWSVDRPEVVRSSFRAKMRLHGVEKDMTGIYSIKNSPLSVAAEFEIKLSDYKIENPVYLGVKVFDLVKVTTDIKQITLKK